MTKLHSLLLATALCASCSKSKDDKASGSASAQAPEAKTVTTDKPTAPPPAAEPAKPASTVTVDPEIQRMVKDMVAKCTIDTTYMNVQCNNNEDGAIIDYAAQKKISNMFESLAEIALTDGAKDPKTFTAIVATWNTFRDPALEKQNATPAAAERVLKLYPTAAKAGNWQYAAAIPLIAGKRAELTEIISKLPPEQEAAAVQQYLMWGGAAALPDVQTIYKTATDDQVKSAATNGVGLAIGGPFSDGTASDADKATLCDWAKSVVTDASASEPAFAGAAESLDRCKGAYIDDVIAGVDARLAKGKLTFRLANNLYHTCWAEGLVGGTPNGTKDQCAKAFAVLAKGIDDKDAPVDGRTTGLSSVGFLGENDPDLKPKAKALAGKYASDKQLGQSAKSALDDLNKK